MLAVDTKGALEDLEVRVDKYHVGSREGGLPSANAPTWV